VLLPPGSRVSRYGSAPASRYGRRLPLRWQASARGSVGIWRALPRGSCFPARVRTHGQIPGELVCSVLSPGIFCISAMLGSSRGESGSSPCSRSWWVVDWGQVSVRRVLCGSWVGWLRRGGSLSSGRWARLVLSAIRGGGPERWTQR
jgi:hypothetical protein